MQNIKTISQTLNNKGIAVLPTDTIYGIHCCAKHPDIIDKIYEIKERDKDIPLIVLIDSIDDLEEFGVVLKEEDRKQIEDLWPGPNTLILEVSPEKNGHLHRGKNTIAFRIPNYPFLRSILRETGPLVSTSANKSGKEVSNNINDILETFGDSIDIYIDGGELNNSPSNIYSLENGTLLKIR